MTLQGLGLNVALHFPLNAMMKPAHGCPEKLLENRGGWSISVSSDMIWTAGASHCCLGLVMGLTEAALLESWPVRGAPLQDSRGPLFPKNKWAWARWNYPELVGSQLILLCPSKVPVRETLLGWWETAWKRSGQNRPLSLAVEHHSWLGRPLQRTRRRCQLQPGSSSTRVSRIISPLSLFPCIVFVLS